MLRLNYFIGTIKEGDYLIQVGVYSLVGVDIATALELVERAYDDGRKVYFSPVLLVYQIYYSIQSVTFVAARQQKSDVTKKQTNHSTKNHQTPHVPDREGPRSRSFVEYENAEEVAGNYEQPAKVPYSKMKVQEDDTRF